jgi:hypothetical protein
MLLSSVLIGGKYLQNTPETPRTMKLKIELFYNESLGMRHRGWCAPLAHLGRSSSAAKARSLPQVRFGRTENDDAWLARTTPRHRHLVGVYFTASASFHGHGPRHGSDFHLLPKSNILAISRYINCIIIYGPYNASRCGGI